MPNRPPILLTADLHLGRRPTHVRSDDPSIPVHAVWQHMVQRAIEKKAGLILIAGDWIDRKNKLFEAEAAIRAAVEKLAKHDIHICTIAGNHDHDSLPAIVDAIDSPHLHLLGRGGHWSSWTWTPATGDPLAIHGWSFPHEHHPANPLDTFTPPTSGDWVGLLHTQLNQAQSPYAPVPLSQLQNTSAKLWLIGHVHARQHFEPTTPNQPHVLYPGSPQPLHPAEDGIHSHTWYDPDTNALTPESCATIRYESIDIDLTDIENENELDTHFLAERNRLTNELATDIPHLRELILRADFIGRTTLSRDIITDLITRDHLHDPWPFSTNQQAHLDQIRIATQPAIDLNALADLPDALGITARLIQELQTWSPNPPTPPNPNPPTQTDADGDTKYLKPTAQIKPGGGHPRGEPPNHSPDPQTQSPTQPLPQADPERQSRAGLGKPATQTDSLSPLAKSLIDKHRDSTQALTRDATYLPLQTNSSNDLDDIDPAQTDPHDLTQVRARLLEAAWAMIGQLHDQTHLAPGGSDD